MARDDGRIDLPGAGPELGWRPDMFPVAGMTTRADSRAFWFAKPGLLLNR
jgi:hypothetical protein